MEQNYFIRGFAPPPGVDYLDFSINGKGVVIDQAAYDKLIGLGFKQVDQKATGLQGLVEINLVSPGQIVESRTEEQPAKKTEVGSASPQFSISWKKVESMPASAQARFSKPVKEILLPVVNKNIDIFIMEGSNQKAIDSDKVFNIFLCCGNAGGKNTPTPKTIWGVRTECAADSFCPTGRDKGVPIVDFSTGYAVGELIGNNLYVHYHIYHSSGSVGEIEIFKRVLQEVVSEISLSPEEKAELLLQRQEAERARIRQAYIEECSNRFKDDVRETQKRIKDDEAAIVELGKQLTQRMRKLQEARDKLARSSEFEAVELEKYGQEFDKLLALPKVINLQAAKGIISVFTDTLYCVDPRTKITHEIGKFRIEIYTDGSNGGVRWFNLTHQINGQWSPSQAPHIDNNGIACNGNTEGIWPELIAAHEFSAVALIAIQFVESVNLDDQAGAEIGRWPVVDK